MITRIIVAGLIKNKTGELLFCKMPKDRGVFPGKWGFPGGGIEPDETLETGLRRELREEIGVEVSDIQRLFFKDGRHEKIGSDGSKSDVYMIFLVFTCVAESENLKLNDEFTDYKWVPEEEYATLDLNIETIDTLKQLSQI